MMDGAFSNRRCSAISKVGGKIMEGIFVVLTFVLLSTIFMLGAMVRELILEFKKSKRNRIIKEKGYLPIEMEKKGWKRQSEL